MPASTGISPEQKEALERVRQTKARHQAYRTHIERSIARESRIALEEKRGVYRKPKPRKFRKSTLAYLVSIGKIGPEEQRAADEIESVFRYITQGLGARTMCFSAVSEQKFRGAEDAPAWLISAYTKRYKPWALECSHSRSIRGKSFCIALRILIEGAHATCLDKEMKLRAGTSIELFLDALERYVEMAGWRKAQLDKFLHC